MNHRQIARLIVSALVGVGASSAWAGETVVHLRLRGGLAEAPPKIDIQSALLGGDAPTSMFDLLKKFNKIRKDDDVAGVLVELDEASLGISQVQELRSQFKKLRAADKDVWVFAETLTPGQYLLASEASKIVMMPKGELVLMGMYADSSYFKNMLDKIGVEADIIHCGDFKSAGEPFYRTEPSEPQKKQTNRLLDSIFEQMITLIAESRKLSPEDVRHAFDHAMFSPQEAKEAKLVDELMYREDLKAALKKRYGDGFKLARNYGKDKGPEIDFENPFAIFKLFGDIMKDSTKKKHKASIGVVYVDSMIVSGSSEDGFTGNSSGSTTIRRAIEKATEDDSVKALVLRVASPGGSAIASDVICEAIKRCQKEKPVVVSMGDVAASGGYYVSCLADTIFAEPGTITGSIGVVGGKFVTKGLWDWVGVTSYEYKRGARADIMNTNRKFNEDERKVISDVMNRVYDDFKTRVTTGRGKKLTDDLDKLAGGRVYSGKDALKIGLVDQLGGFADAVAFAAEKADLPKDKYELRVFPEPKNFMDLIFKSLMGKEDDEEAAVRVNYGRGLMLSPAMQSVLPMIEAVDPQKAASIRKALMQIDLMGRENVLVIDPAIPTVK